MSAQIISGKDIANEIRAELTTEVARLKDEAGVTPGLATVLVGDDPASQMYVGMKNKAAAAMGIHSRQITLPADTPEDELLGVVAGLNADADIHGILVQSPLPDHINEGRIVEAIDPSKDVDGLHPLNVGRIATDSDDFFAPCTPAGVIEMLTRNGHDPAGKHVVVVGRSNLVGRPLSSLLMRKAPGGNATVTVCHSRTPDLGAMTRTADILVVAMGRPETITADMVASGAVVIDVGTNRVDDETREKGYRVCGDVLFDEVSEVAAAISPVPGGVGPMTITMLLSNTVKSARLAAG
ncbi:MAG: bifunctional methylenetetrahydrofolate dehydrogenase/methenyltetrahydrofolate cyclohydrolase FolD [Gemmatimonadetes bacterium]|jgi:methylenetetrahydrofolate dehydrogenase (NADP+)/methenyltetrahydrofolate cyclohydrolase|nr:bifunctional methylenetetrahydrofolate dehydrogenase/methenyltetrahydrofolate cyclohydrolase FolD [Gemmatimonadota bacterium]HAC07527.1 bifunctional methylenetetrahydrofolate dehydrogenase/methenyltetrahydrofolate cyclohydrolase FolD [Gemmatimonadota bacterium]HBD98310.1 bifunctional methylenetetrahydrofolate dehydrogenase/methenyltetrahydrofolate cyclohydrolase FolD [Gemmatimonadota bacterium]HIN51198.1 bifunctional methylenetetrahydrofolate dehydrogenase/methenyltetrahydrofolate cyclohydrol|tara:strand:- start:997 stop:1884 length:888 start_codon:yes stop_codon:yes gene_type:complete